MSVLHSLSPDQWEPMAADQLSALNPAEQAMAMAFVQSCHSSGRAVPFAVCKDLAQYLSSGAQASAGVWPGFAKLMARDLAQNHAVGTDRAEAEDKVRALFVLWQREPWFAARAVLHPVADQVLPDIGDIWFFAGEGFAKTGKLEQRYREFEDRFVQRFNALLLNRGPAAKLWRLSTYYASLRLNEGGLSQAGYPLNDLALRLYLDTEHADQASGQTLAEAKQLTLDSRAREGHKPQQDGVTGVRQIRSFDDLGAVMQTELKLPPKHFMYKFLNDGVLGHDRPPPVTQTRRAVLGYANLAGTNDARASVAEAAWWRASIPALKHIFELGYDEVTTLGLTLGPKGVSARALANFNRADHAGGHGHNSLQARMAFLQEFAAHEAPFYMPAPVVLPGQETANALRLALSELETDCGVDGGLAGVEFAHLSILVSGPSTAVTSHLPRYLHSFVATIDAGAQQADDLPDGLLDLALPPNAQWPSLAHLTSQFETAQLSCILQGAADAI